MTRKTVPLAILLAAISTPCLSAGFYVGAGIGPEAVNFDQSATIIRTNLSVKDETQLSGTGIFGSVFAGYHWSCRQFYIAGEINANLSSVEFTSSNDEFVSRTFSSTHYRIRHSYGISVLPGYLFTPCTLFYGRLGYSNGHFRIRTSDESLANISKNLGGLRLGVGVQQSITERLAVRMEFDYINYEAVRFTVLSSNATTKRTRIRPELGQVEFGLVYNIC